MNGVPRIHASGQGVRICALCGVFAGLSALGLVPERALAQSRQSAVALHLWRGTPPIPPLGTGAVARPYPDTGPWSGATPAAFGDGRTDATAPPPIDRWFGPDKARHFLVSAGIQMAGYSALRILKVNRALSLTGATLATATAGFAKELYDARAGGHPSRRDLVWDGIGLVAGSGLVVAVDGRP